MKKPPTAAAWAKREKLQALADYGIEGERENARAKLKAHEEKWDFTGTVPDPVGPDLFRTIPKPEAGESRPIATFSPGEDETAAFVKWALQNAFNVQGSFRVKPDGITICANIAARCQKGVAKVAVSVRDSFRALWAQFQALPGANSDDRRLFLRGLYDGMMNDERAAGTPLPRRAVPPPASRKSRKAVALAPGVAIHPYVVALDLGRKIRLMVPSVELVAELRSADETARLHNSEKIAA